MLKNIAGQKIGVQMINIANGKAFTGVVTVYVCGDAGSQALGSVGSGVCTHEGNGYHTYAPSKAETNYNLIAFTFIGTGAIPVTIQAFTFTSTGFGSVTWPYVLTRSATGQPIAGATVWVSSDSDGATVLASGITDSTGTVVFYLDTGTVYVWRSAIGFSFDNPDTEVIS